MFNYYNCYYHELIIVHFTGFLGVDMYKLPGQNMAQLKINIYFITVWIQEHWDYNSTMLSYRSDTLQYVVRLSINEDPTTCGRPPLYASLTTVKINSFGWYNKHIVVAFCLQFTRSCSFHYYILSFFYLKMAYNCTQRK